MKKNHFLLIALAILLFFLPNKSFAQFEGEGSLVANVGLGLGTHLGYGGFPLSISADYGVTEKITVGGFLGYNRSSRIFPGNFKWTLTNTLIGARGAYHHPLIEEFDTYAGLMLGYNVISTRIEPNQPNALLSNSYAFLGGFVGINHFFTDQIGGFAELGYGVGYLTVGVTFRIK